MFSNNQGNVVLHSTLDPLPRLTLDEIPSVPRPAPPPGAPARGPGPQGPFDGIYTSVTREDSTGDIILKLVNVQSMPQHLQIEIQGASTVKKTASGEVLTGDPAAMNTVAEPSKVVPRPITIENAGASFPLELPAHSVSVIRLKTR
jgi:hypothetical protein